MLVRYSDLSMKDQVHFRNMMKRTRMTYDSLRVLASIEDEKRIIEEKKVADEVFVEAEKRLVEKRLDEDKIFVSEAVIMETEMGAGDENMEEAATGVEGEMLNGTRCHNHIRGDIKAARLMKDRELWLYGNKRIVRFHSNSFSFIRKELELLKKSFEEYNGQVEERRLRSAKSDIAQHMLSDNNFY